MEHLKKFEDFTSKTTKSLKEDHQGVSNYMFFQNLETIKKSVESMLSLDATALDKLLNEHDWASDHITSAKDDVEEVCNFMCNMLKSDVTHSNPPEN